MTEVKKETTCEEASLKVGEAFKTLMSNTKKALADGWQPGQDVPAILLGSMNDVLGAVSTANQLPEDAKKPVTMAKSIAIPLLEGVEILVQG